MNIHSISILSFYFMLGWDSSSKKAYYGYQYLNDASYQVSGHLHNKQRGQMSLLTA